MAGKACHVVAFATQIGLIPVLAPMSETPRIPESFLLALLPLMGIAIVAIHQMGQYQFFGVPLEYLEIDTVKIILSGLSLSLYSTAGIYALALLYNKESIPTGPKRFLHHLFIASFIAMPFWISNFSFKSSISWPTVIFVLFCSVVTASAEFHFRRLRDAADPLSRLQVIESIAGIAFFVTLLILIATYVHGGIVAKDQKQRTFISGTNRILIARSGDILITKEYDPATQSIDKTKTILVVVESTTTLVTQHAPIR